MKVRLIICVFIVIVCSIRAQNNQEEFIATHEWQTVREGQILPAGLHIRLDLETGLRAAKLLDPNEQSSNSIVAVPTQTTPEEISRQNLEQAFANLDLSKDDIPTDKTHEEKIRRKFRSYDELKKDFESMNVKIQTDQEILSQLIEQLIKTDNDDNRQTILIDLEYYLHQYDNAIAFSDMNGLNLLIQLLNSTDTPAEIRQLTSLALGAAFQGNPLVQLKGLHLGFIQSLLRLLSLELDENLKIRLLYPLSTLLRHFPQGQSQLLDYGGAEAMVHLVDSTQSNQKLAVRVVTLMNDLIIEKDQAMDGKQAAYDNIHLRQKLVDHGWCLSLSSRLQSFNIDDFDHIEKTVHALIPLVDVCRQEFVSLVTIFDKFHEIFTQRHSPDDPSDTNLLNDLQILRRNLRAKSSDEL